eukprot:jgi/Chrzof1/928/Cz01g34040.t1
MFHYTQAWDAPDTALLLNERLINCPPQVAPPLVQALFDEITWATEDEKTQVLKDSFRFKQYILLTRVYCDPIAEPTKEAGPSSSTSTSKKQKKRQQAPSGPVIVYVRPEDEFFHQHCTTSYTFPVEGRPVAKDELQPLRMVMLFSADKVPKARAALDSVVGNAAAGGQ